jgi:hypothetical protein
VWLSLESDVPVYDIADAVKQKHRPSVGHGGIAAMPY